MNTNLIYAKTPTGEEAVRQSTRVVQRNLRMVLVQVDGKMSVQELSTKIGNPRLVEAALRELEEGGYIVPTEAAAWESGTPVHDAGSQEIPQPMSQFSVFGAKTATQPAYGEAKSAASNFSSFGKPILPSRGNSGISGFKPSMMPPPFQVEPAPAPEPKRVLRLTGRHIVVALLAAGVLSAATLVFYPYDRFLPELEAAASKYVGSPVTIGRVGLAVIPAPHLKLNMVKVGVNAEGSIAEIRISSPWALLRSGPHEISRVEVSGASLSSKQLVSLPFFKAESENVRGALVRKVHLEHFEIVFADKLSFPGVQGELSFRSDGSLEKANFESDDRSLLIGAQPAPLGIALNIEGRAWKPAGTSAVFASLQAKGLLQGEKLLVQNIDTTFLGGILRGNWLLDWGNKGLSMAGDGTLSRIDMRKLSAAFVPSLKMDGEMSGSLKLRANARSWDGLWRNAEAVLSTEISRGALYGVDLGEAARRDGTSDVRGGATKFDWLRSTVTVTPRQIASRDVRIDAGVVTATGQFVAERDGHLEGNMSVVLQSSVSRTSVPVRVYGTLPDLTAVGRK